MSSLTLNSTSHNEIKNTENYFAKYQNIQDGSLLAKLDTIEGLINFFENANQAWLEQNKPFTYKIFDKITQAKIEGRLTEQQISHVVSLANTHFLLDTVVVIIEFPDKTKIFCEKTLLLFRSAYFHILFSTGMKEAQTNKLQVQCANDVLALTKMIFQDIVKANSISGVQLKKELDELIKKTNSKSLDEMNEEELNTVLNCLKELHQKSIHEWNHPGLKKLIQQEAAKYIERLQEYNFTTALAMGFELEICLIPLMVNLTEHFGNKVIFLTPPKGDDKRLAAYLIHPSEEIFNEEVLSEYQMIFSAIAAEVEINVVMLVPVDNSDEENDGEQMDFSFLESITGMPRIEEKFKITGVLTIHKNEISIELNTSINENTLFQFKTILSAFPNAVLQKLNIKEGAHATPEEIEKLTECFPKIKALELSMKHDGHGLLCFPSSLEELTLYGDGTELPDLPPNLKKLYLIGGKYQTLPKLPDSLESLELFLCDELTILPLIPDHLKTLKLERCNKAKYLPVSLANVEHLILKTNNKLKKLPSKFPQNLKSFKLFACRRITELPTLPDSLEELVIKESNVDHLPNKPLGLKKLKFKTS